MTGSPPARDLVVGDRVHVRCWPAAGGGTRVPVVMVPGASQTGAVFESTPDGRAGWAPFLRTAGHPVYVVDPPASGRSPHDDARHGPLSHYGAPAVERFFTDPAGHRLWPRAAGHTRWPGSGRPGDPVFERFLRATVGYLPDLGLVERLTADAVVAVLDRIGDAVLLTHSQAGPAGWSAACRRPSLVRAVVAVEPTGPPFYDVGLGSDGPPGHVVARPHGITITPLTRDGAGVPRRTTRTIDGLRVRYGVVDPPGTLPALAGVPVLVVTGDASYHAHYDELTVEYLRARGVPVEHRRLDEVGIRGNGHMMMVETNSDDIAREIVSWISGEARQKMENAMADKLYGKNTELAVSASLDSSPELSGEPEFVRAYAEVKAACARANVRAGVLDAGIGTAIEDAAREVADGHHPDQFPSRIGASAGTWGVNMNLNEVLATRAGQLLDGVPVHPNDHVNRSQSTNDTYPAAMMLALQRIAPEPVRALDSLATALDEKAAQYQGWRRLGRTCLRDAVSAPIDGTHRAQAAGIRRVRDGLEQSVRPLLVLPLGATAIGTGIGAPPGFAEVAVAELATVSGVEVTHAPDLLDAMAHADRWAAVAAAGRRAAALLSKLATDVRLLSSGPHGGLGEINLVEHKPGSSIMPGKKNPSVAQMTMRLAVRARGAAATVDGAVESAELEINEMLPVIFEALLRILRDVHDAATAMAERLVPLIEWDSGSVTAKVEAALDTYVDLATRTGYDQATSSAAAAR